MEKQKQSPFNRRLSARSATVALILLAFFALQIWAVHDYFTTVLPGGNDFYPRWAGARALLTTGENPYSDAVTASIEAVLDPRSQRTNSFNFAFPLHVLAVMGPLGYVDYAWAQAIWIVTIVWLMGGLVVVLFTWLDWRPRPALAGLFIFGSLLFYPVARTIFLGQFTVHVTFFLGLSLLLWRRRHPFAAGVALSVTSIKPQMVFLIAPVLVIVAARRGDYRMLWGVLAGGTAFLAATLLLVPTWPLDFYRGLFEYSSVAAGQNPVAVLVTYFWPEGQPLVVAGLSVMLLAGFGAAVYFWWRRPVRDALPVVAWAMVVTLLVTFQTGTTNQVMLLIPWLAWAKTWLGQGRRRAVLLLAAGLLLGLWLLFQQTVIRTSAENDIMFLPFPILTLAILLAPRNLSQKPTIEGRRI